MRLRLTISHDALVAFCNKWGVRELAVFGSAIPDDFRPESDVDVLVTFASGSIVSLLDWGLMMDELSHIFRRSVHLVEKSAVKNPIRRRSILADYEVLYAA